MINILEQHKNVAPNESPLHILDITAPDINNGNGIRVTIWVAGCTNHCKGCHNQWTWNFNQGRVFKECKEDIYKELANWLDRDYVEGLTFSGGDPMTQDDTALKEELEIMKWVKEKYPTKNIWLYTGMTLEDITERKSFFDTKAKKAQKTRIEMLSYVDTLVDGPYIEELRDVVNCPFRGSTNQRLIKNPSSFKK